MQKSNNFLANSAPVKKTQSKVNAKVHEVTKARNGCQTFPKLNTKRVRYRWSHFCFDLNKLILTLFLLKFDFILTVSAILSSEF